MNRPSGITLLSVLWIFGGFLAIGVLALMPRRLWEGFQRIGYSELRVYLYFGTLSLVSLGGGIGMLSGRRWGWWLVLVSMAYSFGKDAFVLEQTPSLVEHLNLPAQKAAAQYGKVGMRLAINALLFWYFFTDTVDTYFNFASGSRLRRFRILFSIAAGTFLIMTGIGAVAG